ncbi:isocitrate lyase/PEP mutase family protein [Peptoniphilus sp. AGMB00490]|uniref:Isocitrate lyase/PEP mutase family protein n=1 Tax=Peptoniphilus faecalis TaxID=2731255 RepID=A0A848RD09_9FIRM|nr:isocitrate lyase/PEP mutase family protein [Peptoniphilus faecalis]NMW85738.1 isocitrate lyase/PEP mutase family protein [Peptoniphilus faecalis]
MKKTKARMLRDLLESNETIIAPCAYDALSAKIIAEAGFKLVATSGFDMHAAMLGTPDNGQLAFNEMIEALGKMVDAVDVPILADAEAGYGNAINTIRTVRTFEKAGLAGIFIEDQKLPPNCPFVKETEVVSVDEMVGKIRAAVDTRVDPDFVIVARSDAPFEEAIRRAPYYLEAGADMIKINTKTREQLIELPKRVDALLHVGFDGGTEMTEGLTAWDAGKLGYKIVTYPTSAICASVKAMQAAMKELYETGTDNGFLDKIMPFNDFLKFIGKEDYAELEKKYLRK